VRNDLRRGKFRPENAGSGTNGDKVKTQVKRVLLEQESSAPCPQRTPWTGDFKSEAVGYSNEDFVGVDPRMTNSRKDKNGVGTTTGSTPEILQT